MIQVGFLLLFCIATVTAGAPASDNKPCVSTFKPATNFNATQFAGTWYQVRNIFSTPEREITCKKATYTANPDGTLKVEFSWFDAQKVPQKRIGTVKNVGAKRDAKLAVTIGKTPVTYTLFYLSYATFFGVYACIDK